MSFIERTEKNNERSAITAGVAGVASASINYNRFVSPILVTCAQSVRHPSGAMTQVTSLDSSTQSATINERTMLPRAIVPVSRLSSNDQAGHPPPAHSAADYIGWPLHFNPSESTLSHSRCVNQHIMTLQRLLQQHPLRQEVGNAAGATLWYDTTRLEKSLRILSALYLLQTLASTQEHHTS